MTVLFSYAFRPLFLLATLYAVAVIPFWVAAWLGYLPLPMALGTPSWWHAHEMVFGFAGAAVGGFALTAVATWTKRPPVAGASLMVLSGLWVVARVLFFMPSTALRAPAFVADLGYGLLLFALMTREVVVARNERNYKILALLALLPLANALFFVGLLRGTSWTMRALLAGLWTVVLLVNLVAGRIVPAFTRNWLKLHGRGAPDRMPPMFGRLDGFATWLLVAFAVLHVLDAPPQSIAIVGVVLAATLLMRLARWRGLQTVREPLLWVMHVGFLWLPIGVLLLSAAELGLVPPTTGIHALGAGAITTMVVAVASRAALGHTSRPLQSHPLLTASYVLITVAAICRVASTIGPAARPLLMVSGAAWLLGFACFAWRYVPILTTPRLQEARSLPLT